MSDLVDKYLGEGMSIQGVAKEIKRKHKKVVSIDDLMVYMAQEGLHPDDDMPDLEDALNSMGVKVMPTWSTKKTKVGDKPGRNVGNDPKSWGGALARKHRR